jgi:hypothetical protein
VTSRAAEIQTLIADINKLLAQNGKRLPKVLSTQAQEPRQVLERTRDFLVSLGENETLQSDIDKQPSERSQSSPLLAKFFGHGNHQVAPPPENQPVRDQNREQGYEQSTFVSQPQSEFSPLIEPLRAELAGLLQERATLVQEVRQLEQRRLQNYSLSQQMANQDQMISEFLQVLMNRLVPHLTPEMANNLASSQRQQFLNLDAPSPSVTINNRRNIEPVPPESPLNSSLLEPTEQIERLTRFAKELDRRLLSLDGTVNVVFDALQGNINTYHESLSQALARMHSKGVQGEHLMVSFLHNLTLHLQQQLPISPHSSEENTTPTPSLTTDSVQVNPSVSVTSPQLLASTTNTNQIAPTDLEEDNSSQMLENLDAVLLQLNRESQRRTSNIRTKNKAVNLQQDSSAFIREQREKDEVDQLYASLFGNEDLTQPSFEVAPSIATTVSPEVPTPTIQPAPEITPLVTELLPDELSANLTTSSTAATQEVTPPLTNELSATPITQPVIPEITPPVADELSTNAIASPSTPPSELESQVDSPVAMPDPWLEELNRGSLQAIEANRRSLQDSPVVESSPESESWDTLFHEEDTEIIPPQEAVATLATPAKSDTIARLTDLLINVSDDTAIIPATTAPRRSSEIVISDEEFDLSIDSYIPASPQENLLSQQAQSTAVPDISLDEEQLQQLDWDLANFDRQLNSEPEAGVNLGNQLENKLENQETVSLEEVSAIAPTFLDLNPENETKTTTDSEEIDSQETSDSSISNSIDNTEIALNLLNSVWYLGIDLGTTGISAALLNRSTNVVYPLYWSAQNQPEAISLKRSFRLPAEVYLPKASIPHLETESKEAQEEIAPAAVASETVSENLTNTAGSEKSAPSTGENLYSAQLKPYLQVAIPYKSDRQKWEPVLQLNEFSAGPLIWVVRSLAKLLSTLKCDRTSTTPGLTAFAVDINEPTFSSIINNIAGVICTCPSNWTEQYRFNIREALLTSKIVEHPQNVFFVEEAIASLLSELDGAGGESVKLSTREGSRLARSSEHPVLGNTLVINIGATATEMALVDLPEHLQELTHKDFLLHGFAYAGKSIDQDIICQLLLPAKWQRSRVEAQSDRKTISSSSWHWQPSIPGLDQMRLSSLGWEQLELPRAGEPDINARIRLQQRLESSLLGHAVMDAAIALKLILQHQESFTLELADRQWVLQRRDLESQVFVPFVRRLNRELNRLLVARGIPTEAINQAILTGGVGSLNAVSRWLRQKLPNAKIIQDLYLGENGAPTCSRVAYGLAMLPLHPQVLEVPRQQYTDYFLFTELLRLLPERPLSFGEVIQLFENRGINTRTCQQRLLAFLEGELPPGFIPSTLDSSWLTQSSLANGDYKAIATAPLFEKQGSLTYRPNSQQLQSLRRYLDAIKNSTQQSLEEPYTVNFALEISH